MKFIPRTERRSFLQAFLTGTMLLAFRKSVQAANTSVGLQCVTADGGEKPERHFSITFESGNRWKEMEPGSTSDVFKTKSGNYVVVANTTSLKSGDEVTGILRNFNPDTAKVGDSGNDGKALETGRIFAWKVDIIVP